MKLLILLFLITSTALANFLPESKIDGSIPTVAIYTGSKKCETAHKEKCVRLPDGYSHHYHVLADEMVDDIDNPIWASRSMVESCADESDCRAKALAKNKENPADCIVDDARLECSVQNCVDDRESYFNEEYSEVWCNKITGYNKKATGNKIVVVDSVKKASYDSALSSHLADKAAMAIALKSIDCGKKVIARMLLQNQPKNLTVDQVKTMVNTYAGIKGYLETGSLESAKTDILAVAVDGVIVTEADKTALVTELDACKP